MQTGQVIAGRYEVERTIARGGMATVYVVRHHTLGSRHALKVLDLPTSSIKERLLTEGRIQASLKHPGIVPVTDSLDVDGQPALVMEFVDGPSLADVLEQGSLDPDVAEAWFLTILGAVRYAHDRGLVHRDLKPDNVLMAPVADTPGGMLPKVTDFGIAKVVQDVLEGGENQRKTRTGIAMGTPAYMPPEQMQSAGGVDHRADVFALGCILYEMMCGKRAFEGENLLSVYALVADADYEPPGQIIDDLPDRVIAAIEGCLEPHLDDRIGSCDELREILTGEKVVVPRTPAPRARRTRPDPTPRAKKAPSGGGHRGRNLGVLAMALGVPVLLGLLLMAVIAVILVWSVSATVNSPYGQAYDPSAFLPPNAAPFFTVTVHDVSTTYSLATEFGAYQPDQASATFHLVDVEITYDGATTHYPGDGWSMLQENGVERAVDPACTLYSGAPLDAFRGWDPGDRIRGTLCFQAPPDLTGHRLRFKPDMMHPDVLYFPLD